MTLTIRSGTPTLVIERQAGSPYVVGTIAPQTSNIVPVQTATVAAASSTISITGLSSDYHIYDIIIDKLTFSTDGTLLRLRTSTNGGSSFDAGVTDYTTAAYYNNGGTAGSYHYKDSLPLIANVIGAGTNEDMTLSLRVFAPSDATQFTRIEFKSYFLDTSAQASVYYGTVVRLSAADVDAIQLFPGAGTFGGGNIKVYGWRSA